MSDERRRYARFYYERFRSEHPDLYANSTTLGDFLKLLVESELAWPNDPEFPRSVRKSSIAAFVEAELVQVSGYGFRLRGFSAERERRSAHASAAASSRHARSMPGARNGHTSSIAQNLPKTKKKKEDEELEGEQGVRPLAGRHLSAVVDPL